MEWILAAPFVDSRDNHWMEPFVPDGRHRFHPVPAAYRHDRSRDRTSAIQWLDYFRHAGEAWEEARSIRGRGPVGYLTVFPQLAITIGLRKRLSGRDAPLVAWTFNLGRLYTGAKGALARLGLAAVDRFVVHSRHEIDAYSRWLRLPQERFKFVPLQRAVCPVEFPENQERPFVLAMGSARRDYRLFLAAMKDLNYPAVIVASPHTLEGLPIPPNVTVYHSLSIAQCHALAQRARVNVVPVDNADTASGQVTLIDAMMYARATVATRTVGTEDYAEHEATALLVRPGDAEDMKAAISALWKDAALRDRIGRQARNHVIECYSDEAVGRIMGTVLDELASSRR